MDFEADLGDVADQSGHQERNEERKQNHDDRLEEICSEGAGRGDGVQADRVEVSEHPAHECCALLEHLGSREVEHPQRGEQDEGRGNLAAVCDLAALARLRPALAGSLFGAFLPGILRHGVLLLTARP